MKKIGLPQTENTPSGIRPLEITPSEKENLERALNQMPALAEADFNDIANQMEIIEIQEAQKKLNETFPVREIRENGFDSTEKQMDLTEKLNRLEGIEFSQLSRPQITQTVETSTSEERPTRILNLSDIEAALKEADKQNPKTPEDIIKSLNLELQKFESIK